MDLPTGLGARWSGVAGHLMARSHYGFYLLHLTMFAIAASTRENSNSLTRFTVLDLALPPVSFEV